MDPSGSDPSGSPSADGDRRLDAGLAEAFGRREPAASPSVLARLWAAGTPVRRLLLREPPSSHPAAVVRPRPDEAPPDDAGRYRILGEIARGGIGVVLKGHDVDLGRDVAMKVLREEYADRPDVVERFVEEAQIGGQLQHPGIVPVYEIGLSADRRPFFAMKLVKGRTLAALLSERESVAGAQRAHLATFEAVCQTVGYAHSRGVIHRDLKPANVMVGAFGEVQVVDWGLAKVLGQGGVHDERRAKAAAQSVIDTVRTEGTGSASVVGSVIGTPRYMSPEQARGEVDALDTRADVFALGAILCEILTGAPPYRGDDEEVLVQAANASLDDARARLEACGADGELTAIATECMAPAKKARPRDAGAVAARIGAYFASIAQRARAAEIEAAEARVATQAERRRRRVTLALAGTVAALLTLVAGVWIFAEHAARQRAEDARSHAEQVRAQEDQARRRSEAVRSQVDEALHEAEVLRERALGATEPAAAVPLWHDAVGAAVKARTVAASTDATPALRARVEAALEALRSSETQSVDAAARWQRDRQTAFLLREAVHDGDSGMTYEQAEARIGRLIRDHGLDPDAPASTWAPVLERTTIRSALAAAIENWIEVRRAGGRDGGSLGRLLAAVDPHPFSARRRAARTVEELRPLAEEAVASRPEQLVWVAISYMNLGAYDRAAPLLDRAIALLPGEYATRMLAAKCARSVRPPALRLAGQHLSAALALVPRSETACASLTWVLTESGDAPAAVDLATAFLRVNPTDAQGHVRLQRANALRLLSRLAEAEAECRRVLEAVPESVQARVDLATALRFQDRPGEAERVLREALRRDPRSASARHGLGNTLRESGDLDGAIVELRKALAENGTGPGAEQRESHVRADLASVHVLREAYAEALQEIDVALRLQPEIAAYHLNRAAILGQLGRPAEAAVSAKEALRLQPRNPASWNALGIAEAATGEIERAVGAFRQAAALDPSTTLPLTNLALTLRSNGDAVGALAAAEEAVRRAPDLAAAHFLIATAQAVLDRPDEALQAARRAVELAPETSSYRGELATRLFATGHFAEALEAAQDWVDRATEEAEASQAEALQMRAAHYAAAEPRLLSILAGTSKPKDPGQRVQAAHVAHWKRRYASAASQWAEAFRAAPALLQDRDACYDAACAAARAASGSGEEASRLDEATRSSWRRTAMEWLRAALARRRATEEGAPASAAGLAWWLQDSDLAGVRDPAAVATFPESERAGWWTLWGEIRLAAGPWKPTIGKPVGTVEQIPWEHR